MKFFKNKQVLLTPLIAFAILLIFSLTLFPSVQPQPKSLPVAIVNEDQGVELPNQPKMNIGETMVDMMQDRISADDEAPVVKWVEVETEEDAKKGMDNQQYYAAFVIPKEFSAKQVSLQSPSPSSPEVRIYINQGMNTAAATMAGQLLHSMVENMNNQVRTQLLDGFEQQGVTLTTAQARSIANPIAKTVTNVNEIGTNSANGNAPVSLFQPLWMASLASAAILFMAVRKISVANRKESLMAKFAQVLMGAIIAPLIGFGLTWLADALIGLNIPSFLDIALFLSITSFSFYLLISAVLSLLGFRGIPIFVLLLFFGAPLLAMAPEMMSAFYRDWIYSWLPMRFMTEGLRELFYFENSLSWNSQVASLVWIGVVSMIILLLSSLKGSKDAQSSQPALKTNS
jgi:YhgE/Pip-like protein